MTRCRLFPLMTTITMMPPRPTAQEKDVRIIVGSFDGEWAGRIFCQVGERHVLTNLSFSHLHEDRKQNTSFFCVSASTFPFRLSFPLIFFSETSIETSRPNHWALQKSPFLEWSPCHSSGIEQSICIRVLISHLGNHRPTNTGFTDESINGS